MRAILLAASLPDSTSTELFWQLYSDDTSVPLTGKTVYDPFLGGGSTLIEAVRLGAAATGSDIDPLSVAIVRQTLNPPDRDSLDVAAAGLLEHLDHAHGELYPHNEVLGEPIHFFSLRVVTCPCCGDSAPLYRDLILARDVSKSGAVVRSAPVTAFCPIDFSIHHLTTSDAIELMCTEHAPHDLSEGTFRRTRFECPSCGTRSSHRELVTGQAPRRLLAVEWSADERARRVITAPRPVDEEALSAAADRLCRSPDLPIPDNEIVAGRSDDRPRSYGIYRFADLFTERQRLVFGEAFRWLRDADLEESTRTTVQLVLSNALTTNNTLCGYARDYGRIAPLFSVRGYALPSLAVELNPLAKSGGRGTLRQMVMSSRRSINSEIMKRSTWDPAMRAVTPILMASRPKETPFIDLTTVDATKSEPQGRAVDLLVFDPPYYDMIPYDELASFYRAWLGQSIEGQPLHPDGSEGEAMHFGLKLGEAISHALAQRTPTHPAVLTYHSSDVNAWEALGIALDEAKAVVTALWPVRSDGRMGHHAQYEGACEWDLVIAFRPQCEADRAWLDLSVEELCADQPFPVKAVDRASFGHALRMARSRFAAPTASEMEGDQGGSRRENSSNRSLRGDGSDY